MGLQPRPEGDSLVVGAVRRGVRAAARVRLVGGRRGRRCRRCGCHWPPRAWASARTSSTCCPDIDDDDATGVRGLPHRLGARRLPAAAVVVLGAGSALVLLGARCVPAAATGWSSSRLSGPSCCAAAGGRRSRRRSASRCSMRCCSWWACDRPGHRGLGRRRRGGRAGRRRARRSGRCGRTRHCGCCCSTARTSRATRAAETASRRTCSMRWRPWGPRTWSPAGRRCGTWSWPAGARGVAGPMAREVHVVPREVFDARLVEHAVAAGAVLERRRVRPVEVRADRRGARRRGERAGRRRRRRGALGPAAAAGGRCRASRVLSRSAATRPPSRRGGARQVIRYGPRAQPAYAWAFDRGDGWSNVGYGELLPGPSTGSGAQPGVAARPARGAAARHRARRHATGRGTTCPCRDGAGASPTDRCCWPATPLPW